MPSDLYGIDNLTDIASPLKAENNNQINKNIWAFGAAPFADFILQKSIKMKSNPNGKQVHGISFDRISIPVNKLKTAADEISERKKHNEKKVK